MTRLNIDYLSRLATLDASGILDWEQRELDDVRTIGAEDARTARWVRRRQRRIDHVRAELFGPLTD